MEMYVYLQSDFVKQKPEAKAYYELSSDLVAFSFPEPGPLEGVCVFLSVWRIGWSPHLLLSLCLRREVSDEGGAEDQERVLPVPRRSLAAADRCQHPVLLGIQSGRRRSQRSRLGSSYCILSPTLLLTLPCDVGKSTLVKLMVGELEPDQGLIERHPNLRVAYVAQHAFAHIGT